MREQRKSAVEVYNSDILQDPKYTPYRVVQQITNLFYPGEDVSVRTISRLLDTDVGTFSLILNRHIVFSPRVVLSIMDLTGWTREQFNNYSGMKPYVNKPTPEQLQDVRRRRGKLAQSVCGGTRAALGKNHSYPTAWEDTD